MAKGDNYESIELIIDTREKDSIIAQKKNTTRMKIISDFFEDLGACVERKKVDFCDYSIKGTFYRKNKGYEINLGVQYKTLTGDFTPSLPTLPEVLFRAHSEFRHVSLIVEENGHELLMNEDNTDGLFQNYSMQAGCDKQGTGLYSSYKNFMQSMSECGIQSRSIRTSEHFPIECIAIIKHISDPVHSGLCIRPQNFEEELSNAFYKYPGIGIASVEKLLMYIPNLESLVNMTVEELQMILGPLKGKQLFQFIHNNSRVAITSKNWKVYYAKNGPKQLGEKPKEVPEFTVLHETPLAFKDILTQLSFGPCTLEDIKKASGRSETSIFDELMRYREEKKIEKDPVTRLWRIIKGE